MYAAILPYLQCVACGHSEMTLVSGREERGEVIEGGVQCQHCQHVVPIVDGILDMLGDSPVSNTPAQRTNRMPIVAWGYERGWRWYALSLLSGEYFPLRRELRLVCGLLAPRAGDLILDVACSNGLYARACARVAPDAIIAGIDHSWPMLRQARRYARHADYPISFVRATAQQLPFRSGCVAGYGMGASLNEIGDIDAMLRETRRVLADDGRFVSMHLLCAKSRWGQLLQRSLATGGLEFPVDADLRDRFVEAGLQLRAEWRWRVVAIALLRRLALVRGVG